MDNLVQYLVVCGLPRAPKLLDPSRAPDDERARDIMDLAVVIGVDTEPPEGFIPLMHTYHGAKANLDQMQHSALESKSNAVFLAFRRRERGELGPAISSLEILHAAKNEVPSSGHFLLRSSKEPSAKPVNLVPSSSKGVFLACRRQDWHRAPGGLSLAPAIQDLSVVLVGRGETPPPNFTVLDKALNTRSFATKTCLALRWGMPVGLCDLPWHARVLDRYPLKDAPRAEPLPEELLAMFAFPDGLRFRASLHRRDDDQQHQQQQQQQHQQQRPPPMSLFSFTMAGSSSSNGASDQKSYATCCTFYEQLNLGSRNDNAAAASTMAEKISKCHVRTYDSNNAPSQTSSITSVGSSGSSGSGSAHDNDVTLWVPKCVILVSRWPFLRSWRKWLKELVRAATTPSRSPLSPSRASSLLRELTTSADADDSSSGNSNSSSKHGLLDFRPELWLAQLFHATPLPLAPHPFLLRGAGLPVLLPLPMSPRRRRKRIMAASNVSHGDDQQQMATGTAVEQTDENGGEEFVCLRAPPPYGLPLFDLSFLPLFQCLSVDHLLDVLANLLLERKVLLRSRHASLAPDCCEALLALLFPFTWSGAYLPRLTLDLLEVVNCPGALLCGLQDDSKPRIPSTKITKGPFNTATSSSSSVTTTTAAAAKDRSNSDSHHSGKDLDPGANEFKGELSSNLHSDVGRGGGDGSGGNLSTSPAQPLEPAATRAAANHPWDSVGAAFASSDPFMAASSAFNSSRRAATAAKAAATAAMEGAVLHAAASASAGLQGHRQSPPPQSTGLVFPGNSSSQYNQREEKRGGEGEDSGDDADDYHCIGSNNGDNQYEWWRGAESGLMHAVEKLAPDETLVVDLDDDHLFFLGDQKSGSSGGIANSSTSTSGSSRSKVNNNIAQSLHGAAELPRGPALILRRRLMQLSAHMLGKGAYNNDDSNSTNSSSRSTVSSSMKTSFGGSNGSNSSAKSNDHDSNTSEWFDLSTRDAALLFMVQCLDGYAAYMVDPLPDWQYSSSSLWFNRPGFLNAPAPLLAIAQNASPPDKAAHSFLASLLNTQMFAVFEQSRSEGSQPGILFFDDCVEHWQTSELMERQKIEGGSTLLISAAARAISTRELVAPSAVNNSPDNKTSSNDHKIEGNRSSGSSIFVLHEPDVQLSVRAQLQEVHGSEWWWAVQNTIYRDCSRSSTSAPHELSLEVCTLPITPVAACMRPPVTSFGSEVVSENLTHSEGWPEPLNQNWLQYHRHSQYDKSIQSNSSALSTTAPAGHTTTVPANKPEVLSPSPAAAVALRAAYPSTSLEGATGNSSLSGDGGMEENSNMALLCVRTGTERALEVIVRRGPIRERRQRRLKRRQIKPTPHPTDGSYKTKDTDSSSSSSSRNETVVRELDKLLKERSALNEAETARAQVLTAALGGGGSIPPSLYSPHSGEACRGSESNSSESQCTWEVNIDEDEEWAPLPRCVQLALKAAIIKQRQRSAQLASHGNNRAVAYSSDSDLSSEGGLGPSSHRSSSSSRTGTELVVNPPADFNAGAVTTTLPSSSSSQPGNYASQMAARAAANAAATVARAAGNKASSSSFSSGTNPISTTTSASSSSSSSSASSSSKSLPRSLSASLRSSSVSPPRPFDALNPRTWSQSRNSTSGNNSSSSSSSPRSNTTSTPAITSSNSNSTSSSSGEAMWWRDEDGLLVELSSNGDMVTFTLKSTGYQYVIDVPRLEQRNTSTQTRRHVRRRDRQSHANATTTAAATATSTAVATIAGGDAPLVLSNVSAEEPDSNGSRHGGSKTTWRREGPDSAAVAGAAAKAESNRYELDGLIEKAQFSPEDSARANALVQQASSFSSAGHDPATFPPKDSPTCQGDSSSSSGDDRSSSRSSTSNSGEDEDEEKDAAEEANPSETLLGARPLRNEERDADLGERAAQLVRHSYGCFFLCLPSLAQHSSAFYAHSGSTAAAIEAPHLNFISSSSSSSSTSFNNDGSSMEYPKLPNGKRNASSMPSQQQRLVLQPALWGLGAVAQMLASSSSISFGDNNNNNDGSDDGSRSRSNSNSNSGSSNSSSGSGSSTGRRGSNTSSTTSSALSFSSSGSSSNNNNNNNNSGNDAMASAYEASAAALDASETARLKANQQGRLAINPDEASVRSLLLVLNTTAAAVAAAAGAGAAEAQHTLPHFTSAQSSARFLDFGASAEDLMAILKQRHFMSLPPLRRGIWKEQLWLGNATIARQPGALTSGTFTQTLATGWRAQKHVMKVAGGNYSSSSSGGGAAAELASGSKAKNRASQLNAGGEGKEEVKEESCPHDGVKHGEEEGDGDEEEEEEDSGPGGPLQPLFPWLQTLESCGELFQARAVKRRYGGDLSPSGSNNTPNNDSSSSIPTPRSASASNPLSPSSKPPLPPRSPKPVANTTGTTTTAAAAAAVPPSPSTALVKQGNSEPIQHSLPQAPSPLVPVKQPVPQLPHRRTSSSSSSSSSSSLSSSSTTSAHEIATPPPPPPSPPPPEPPEPSPWLKQPAVNITEPKVSGDTTSFEVLDLGLPTGLTTGDDLLVITPTNQRVRVAVPAGVAAGQHFRLQVPVPSPVPKRVHRFGIFVLLEQDAVNAETKASSSSSNTRRRSSSGSSSAAAVAASSQVSGNDTSISSSSTSSEAHVETAKLNNTSTTPSTLTSSKLKPQGPNGLVSSRALAEHPAVAGFTLPYAVCYKPQSEEGVRAHREALAQEALQTHQKAVATFHAERVARMKAELAASAAAEAETAASASGAASGAAGTTTSDGDEHNCAAVSSGAAAAGGSLQGSDPANQNRSSSLAANAPPAVNATIEEKLAAGARQLSSTVLGHRNACFTCSFTDPSAIVAALYHRRRRRHTSNSAAASGASHKGSGSNSRGRSSSSSSGGGPGNEGFYAIMQQRRRQQSSLNGTSSSAAPSGAQNGPDDHDVSNGNIPSVETPADKRSGNENGGDNYDDEDGDAAAIAEVDGWLRLFGYRGTRGSGEGAFWHLGSSNGSNSPDPELSNGQKKRNYNSSTGGVVSYASYLAQALVINCGIRCLKSLVDDLTEETATIAASAAVAASSLSQAQASSGSDRPANAAVDADALIAKDVAFLMSLKVRSSLAPVAARGGKEEEGEEEEEEEEEGKSGASRGSDEATSKRRLSGVGPEHLKVAVLWSAPPQAATSTSRFARGSSSQDGSGEKDEIDGSDEAMHPLGAPLLDEESMATWLEANPSKKHQPMLYFRVFEPVLVMDDQDDNGRVDEEEEDEEECKEDGSGASSDTVANKPNKDDVVWRWGVRAWSASVHSTDGRNGGGNNYSNDEKYGSSSSSDDEADEYRRRKSNRRCRSFSSSSSVLLSDRVPRSEPFRGPLDALHFDGGGLQVRNNASEMATVRRQREKPKKTTAKRASDRKRSNCVGVVPYLSPAQVRLKLEVRLAHHGGNPQCLQREAVRRDAPELFWNLWWLCARLCLPFPLPAGPDDLSSQWIGVAAWDATAAHRAAQSTMRLALTRLLAGKVPSRETYNTSSSRSSSAPEGGYSPPTGDSKADDSGVAHVMTLADLTNERLDSTGTSVAAPWCNEAPAPSANGFADSSSSSSASSSSLVAVQLPPWPWTHLADILCPPSDGGCRGGFVVKHWKLDQSHDQHNTNKEDEHCSDDHYYRQQHGSTLQQQQRQRKWVVTCSPELVQEACKAALRLNRPPNDRNYSGGHHSAAAAAAEMVEVASQSSTSALTAYLTGLVKRRLSDPVSFEVNLYRALLRVAVASSLSSSLLGAHATALGLHTHENSVSTSSSSSSTAAAAAARASTLPLPPLLLLSTPHINTSGGAATAAAAAALASAIAAAAAASATENGRSAAHNNNISSSSFQFEPAFERAYQEAVKEGVDDELMPSDRAAAFHASNGRRVVKASPGPARKAVSALVSPSSGASATGATTAASRSGGGGGGANGRSHDLVRRANDLIPIPPALALRAAFGHLF